MVILKKWFENVFLLGCDEDRLWHEWKQVETNIQIITDQIEHISNSLAMRIRAAGVSARSPGIRRNPSIAAFDLDCSLDAVQRNRFLRRVEIRPGIPINHHALYGRCFRMS
jgi:hypothetical protein